MDDNSRLPVGTIIDDQYEVTGYLGRGGFADVYAAKNLTGVGGVAIKVLRAVDNPSSRKLFEQRFVQEARLSAQINHPNVVRILACRDNMRLTMPGGYQESVRLLYIAMDLLEGHTLGDELKQYGAMEPARALRLVRAGLEGLARGHQLGIVHKDLKPANIFLIHPETSQETMKILDYGVARAGQSLEEKLTMTGQLAMTPQYAAPEYLEKLTATPALDVYQMGLILAEMLTGTAVVHGETLFECIMAHTNGVELSPTLLDSPLGPILQRATARDHAARYANAAEFAAALATVPPETIPNAATPGGAPRPVADSFAETMDGDGSLAAPSTHAPAAPSSEVAPKVAPTAAVAETGVAPVAVPVAASPASHGSPSQAPLPGQKHKTVQELPAITGPAPEWIQPPVQVASTGPHHASTAPPPTPHPMGTSGSTWTGPPPLQPPAPRPVWPWVLGIVLGGFLLGSIGLIVLAIAIPSMVDPPGPVDEPEYETDHDPPPAPSNATHSAALGCESAKACYDRAMGAYKTSASRRDFLVASETFEAACEDGFADACTQLGLMTYFGHGVPIDVQRAFDLLEQGCQGGSAKGCGHLGGMYYSGDGAEKDDAKVLRYSKKACEGGFGDGCASLGAIYRWSIGVARDDKKALDYAKKGCKLGSPAACSDLAVRYEHGLGLKKISKKAKANHARALELATDECDDGDPESCNFIGDLYAQGLGTKLNYAKASRFYRQSCDGGSPTGCGRLADLLHNGLGVDKDLNAARELYSNACDRNVHDACSNLAYMMDQGEGYLLPDPASAANLQRRACEHDRPAACYMLGSLLKAGRATPQAPNEAAVAIARSFELFDNYCKGNDANACTWTGYILEVGVMRTATLAEVKKYYKKACDLGNTAGCEALSRVSKSPL